MSTTALSTIRFSDWDLDDSVQRAISDQGWDEVTPIQAETVPLARNGRDLIGQARTGSGKTAAFGIPMIESCSPTGTLQALTLAPTRELAVQVTAELSWLQGDKGLNLITVYGGTDLEKQAKKLDAGVDIIVGTPGRVIDMCKRGHIDLSTPHFLCLDEADRMLDMGFFPDVIWVLERMSNRSQTLLFSATFPAEVLEAAHEFIPDAEHVLSDEMELEIPEIEQRWIPVGRANKLWALGRILATMGDDDQALVFCNTKRMVDMLVERLGKFRFPATGLHGDLPQNRRERILNAFREGKEPVVVATDVAARGLDVDGVTIVVNYDLPSDPEIYVHRIGRTGRMGREGQAWSFVGREDLDQLQKIMTTWTMHIEESGPPELPEHLDRDPVKRQQDWGELSNVYGMVRISLDVGSDSSASGRVLSDWIVSEARLPEIAIGEIDVGDTTSIVEVHRDRVETVLGILSKRRWQGAEVNARLVE
ncbi:MAG: DEAD/DEAH box helicase [Candidatus Poseidoniales archaeon]|nr:DEAD/DEAH box helicase [Candidatus Poseidoniales archaeon]